MNEEFKKAILSKTLWYAVLTGLLGVVVVLSDLFPQIGWIAIVNGVIVTLLRLTTTQPVRL